jgi:hypothetical protein
MPSRLKPLTQSEYLVTIADVTGYFTECSGLEETFETSEFSDGLSKRLRKVRGISQIEDVELTKPFDPEIDGAILELCQEYCELERELTVTIQPIKRCGEIRQYGNKKMTLLGCKLIGVKGFEVDTTSNDVSTLTITLSVDDWQWA